MTSKTTDTRINFLIDAKSRERLLALAEANDRTLSNYMRGIIKEHLLINKVRSKKA